MKVIDNFDRPWSDLNEKYTILIKNASEAFEKLKPLIEYFEAETI